MPVILYWWLYWFQKILCPLNVPSYQICWTYIIVDSVNQGGGSVSSSHLTQSENQIAIIYLQNRLGNIISYSSVQVLFPLLDKVRQLSDSASTDKVDQGGNILIHHSRNTHQKQWAETQVTWESAIGLFILVFSVVGCLEDILQCCFIKWGI